MTRRERLDREAQAHEQIRAERDRARTQPVRMPTLGREADRLNRDPVRLARRRKLLADAYGLEQDGEDSREPNAAADLGEDPLPPSHSHSEHIRLTVRTHLLKVQPRRP